MPLLRSFASFVFISVCGHSTIRTQFMAASALLLEIDGGVG